MHRLLSILLLLSATGAEASVQSFSTDDTATLRPVSMAEGDQDANDLGIKQGCKPVLLFMRFPDGRIALVGIVPSKAC